MNSENLSYVTNVLDYIHAMRQPACVVVNPIAVNNFASQPVGRASDSMIHPT